MARILIVEDDQRIRETICRYAVEEEHQVEEASTGEQGVLCCRKKRYDIVIMDLMLPGISGYEAISEIRKISGVPIVIVSARGEEEDRIHGFEVGADDYLTKPFSPRELMLRIRAILRRGTLDINNHRIAVYGGIQIDFTSRVVMVDDKRVSLSPKEYDLLFFLAQNKNVALTREKLITNVWGYDFSGDERTLDTHIKRLRQNISPYGNRIVTLRGVGYRFEGD